MGSTELPMRLSLGGGDYQDVITSLAHARFVSGEEPFVEAFDAVGVARAADLVPIGSVVRQATESHAERILARGPGWSALVERYRNGNADVSVWAVGPEELAKVVADVRARCPLVERTPGTIAVEFWYEAGACHHSVERRIDAPVWGDITANYAGSVRAKVAQLAALQASARGGRLLLWHGPPGTGKTTAIRALARSWAAWCRTLFVIDPERFFGDAGYMMTLLLGGERHEDDDDAPRWRLIVIEDADELLRADAKRAAGQSLSRLLNLADGFIGQGLKALVLITTNEPLGRLHPAVVRPGRCLAEIEFPPLSPEEASSLLPPGHRVGSELTLAEVFERRGDAMCLRSQPDADRTGQYL